MLLEEGGFKVPLNTPQPLAKNASFTFLMFSSILLLLESVVDHQAPRHLAEWDKEMTMSSNLMDEALPGTDGEITDSHLSAFRERLQEGVSKWMGEICFLQSARFVERV